jgi:hypothetical protein
MNHISNLRPLWQIDNFTKRNFDKKQSVNVKDKKVNEATNQALM